METANTPGRIITLTTDSGESDYFVGAMKGVILSFRPGAQIIDITHEIPPHQILPAALILAAIYRYYSPQTVHLAVVDPGVGSERRPIAIQVANQFFVGPDNGLFSFVIDQNQGARTVHLVNREYWLPETSATFHGRDIFAPVAAALSNGTEIDHLGPAITDPIRLQINRPQFHQNGTISGRIIHVDHFGNCVTNLEWNHLKSRLTEQRFRCQVRSHLITRLLSYYGEDATQPPEPFLIAGSAGFLEISLRCASASLILGVTVGDEVAIAT
ncbi:MAG: SAM-dependent chlorinase/fluorinase [Verrucomicrobia bacterium]|nr:SAM-dependent chlorinase/fluorinase [Verrucomicrobiota bacterium]